MIPALASMLDEENAAIPIAVLLLWSSEMATLLSSKHGGKNKEYQVGDEAGSTFGR